MKRYIIILGLFLFVSVTKAQTGSYDSMQVSLLTIAPNPTAIYTVYGHTALRLYSPDIDVALNWGMFNSHAPNFIYHFVKGETDYFFASVPYEAFFQEYSWKNAVITEQILSIPNENKEAFIQAIAWNLRPENTEYRYNFLFDNCTTRPRDIIEKFCGGKLVYPEQTEKTTFRDLIHSCTNPYPWMSFGIDLVIGSGADSLITAHSELFLPEKLMNALDKAVVIAPDGEKYPVVLSSHILVGEEQKAKEPEKNLSLFAFCLSPLGTGIFILLIYIVLAFVGYKKKRQFNIPFALPFLIAGLAGCIVTMLSFFSAHPCTQYNWNILWLHPLHFLGFAGFFFKKSYPLFRWYHASNLLLLSFLLPAYHWLPQQLSLANIPYILCLWVISGYWLVKSKKR